MDRIISSYPGTPGGDGLVYCEAEGVAYQADTSRSVEYGKDYFDKYVRYEGTEIARRLNDFRTAFSASYCDVILDVGVGSGEFIKESGSRKVYGFDINPYAMEWLKRRGLFIDPYEGVPGFVDGLTFWDALEHIPDPGDLLGRLRQGAFVLVSIPIFKNLSDVNGSKHLRRDEHYVYFREDGLARYMADLGFTLLETRDDETAAGREGILSFCFRRTSVN